MQCYFQYESKGMIQQFFSQQIVQTYLKSILRLMLSHVS